VALYAIYERDPGRVEVYQFRDACYQLLPANERGHFPINALDVELGIWQGVLRTWTCPGYAGGIPRGTCS